MNDPGLTAEKERKILLARFCERKELAQICKIADLPRYEEQAKVPYDEKDEARTYIATKLEEQELSRVMNQLKIDEPSHFPWFRGSHYHIEFEENILIWEQERANNFHEKIQHTLQSQASKDPKIRALLRGIIKTEYYTIDKVGGDFGEVVGAGQKFYEGDSFWPSRKAGQIGVFPGVYTYKTGSGRKFYMAAEVAPIYWKHLENLNKKKKEEARAPPAQEVPEELAIRKPKFKEILQAVDLTPKDKEEFKKILEQHDALAYWADYVAPGVKFREDGKKAILCMLASPEDKHGTKGRTNAVIYGPPGTGKTAFKNFLVDKFGAYSIDGARVSKVDLTYNKARNEEGLLVRAHKGLAVIEEADKMDPECLGAALTALGESGKIEIRDMVLPAEVRGIMLGNFRRRDEIREAWGEAVFNRFEFFIKFEKLEDEELDKTLDWHYKYFRKPKPKSGARRLKKFLKWVRDYEPQIADLKKIEKYKGEHLERIENVREGISVMNVAYTIARLNHRDVTLADYKQALELIT